MANSKQAIKRARQNTSRNQHNRPQVSAMRTAVKKVHKALESGEGDVQVALSHAISAIDRNVSKGNITQNKADREKSRLQKLVAAQ